MSIYKTNKGKQCIIEGIPRKEFEVKLYTRSRHVPVVRKPDYRNDIIFGYEYYSKGIYLGYYDIKKHRCSLVLSEMRGIKK